MAWIREGALEQTIAANHEQIAIELGDAVGSCEDEHLADTSWVSIEELCNGEWSIGAGRNH